MLELVEVHQVSASGKSSSSLRLREQRGPPRQPSLVFTTWVTTVSETIPSLDDAVHVIPPNARPRFENAPFSMASRSLLAETCTVRKSWGPHAKAVYTCASKFSRRARRQLFLNFYSRDRNSQNSFLLGCRSFGEKKRAKGGDEGRGEFETRSYFACVLVFWKSNP